MTERHLSILLQWIRVSHSQPTIASAKSPAGASSDDLYPIPIHSYSVAADYVDAQDRDVTASSLISRSAENTTTRALVDRVVSLALAEDALRQKLSMIQDKLSTFIRVDISSQRTFGAFTFTNLEEVLTELSALDIEVSSLRSSPFLGGVLPIIEDVEMSLSWITCVIKVSSCRCSEWL